MRIAALLVVLIWLPISMMAKVENIDSLRKAYAEAILPEEKITLALILGNHYFYFNQDSAEYFFAAGREALPATGYDSLYIKMYEWSSGLKEILGENPEALAFVHQAWQRVQESGRKQEIDQMYILLGRYHMRSSRYDSASYYWNLLLKSKESKGEEYLKWLPYYYLGGMYETMDDWPKAKTHYLKALDYLRLEKRPKDILYFLHVFIESSEIYGDFDLHSKLKDEYLSIKQASGQNILDAEHSMMMAPDKSAAERRQTLFKHLPYHLKNRSKYSICDSYYRIGQTFLEEKNFSEAIKYLNLMMAYTDTLNIPFLKYNGHFALHKAYLAKGDYQNALFQYEYMYVLRDTLLLIEKQKQLNELNVRFETAAKEKQLAEATLDLETSRKNQQLLSIGLLGAVMMIGLVYYTLREKKKSNMRLEEKNKIISRALEEKDILLREIHHRVKNNLQMISALLYLHGKSVDDTSAQEALMESQNRVQSMAMIHQNLYQHENLLGVSIGEYLDKLLNHLISAYNIEANRISIVKKISVPQLDVDTVIPLALIINELISNALKYAFRDGRKGEIQIVLAQHTDLISVEVNDNGMGLPDHFSLTSSANFGLKLINILCDRLGATWSAQSQNGTQISIHIPYKQAA